ncbi:MAG: hypothetical protein IPK88_18090 [Saprospiraceae bacterium]|nr:hypothetical protein [Candidatus Defluviibacterium haderslevense]
MTKYYFLAENLKPSTAFACTKEATPIAHELISKVIEKSELPFALFLKKVSRGKGGLIISDDLSGLRHIWLDYQPNNLAWPLMSEKMKSVISAQLTGKEGIIWIKAIINGADEIKEYYIPRFRQKLDVLDNQKTIFVKDTSHIIKPVFSLSKIIDYHLFFAPQEFWEITSGLYVSETLKKIMQKEKLTGISFEYTSVL